MNYVNITMEERCRWEPSLKPGSPVWVTFGYGSGFRAEGPAEVVNVNRASFRVRLTEAVYARPAGSHVTVPNAALGGGILRWHQDCAVWPTVESVTCPICGGSDECAHVTEEQAR